jgi:UTP---glucose-1-phosphate uridylyltransferase
MKKFVKITACLFFMLPGTFLLTLSDDMEETLEHLSEDLRQAQSASDKIALLDSNPQVREFLQKIPSFHQLISQMPPEAEAAAKQMIAIGQMERLVGAGPVDGEALLKLLEKMTAMDAFYRELGGIVGYQKKVLQFLRGSSDLRQSEIAAFHAPDFIDITEETPEVMDAIQRGIETLPEIAEMYPLGGAADRLHLIDEETGSELPAAKLGYGGRTLFESLIRDLQAREYLYYKLYGKQVEVPIAIMTSEEKDNFRHVSNICSEHRWFGRKKEHFHLFTQPLVPAVDPKGNWYLLGPLSPILKPGGHGALWKLARDQGIFEWLASLGRQKALIRQINNPIAGLDYGLLAFIGLGVKKRVSFGFASCPRLLHSAEGVNVIVEKKNGDIALTNIEYCDFTKYGIEDKPLSEGGIYSRFSSNTNILFADLKAVENAVRACPFPGLLINLKTSTFVGPTGEKQQGPMARLESTMQNIADVFVEKNDVTMRAGSSLHSPFAGKPEKTFVTYNHRHKTISTAKKAYVPGGSVQETPEECFYVQLQSARDLLSRCGFSLPESRTLEEYLRLGPDALFLYHPALGPLYSLIQQKISFGSLSLGSELQLEITDLAVENLNLEGSLLIHSSQPLGHFDQEGILHFSDKTGRARLKNVSVKNEGVDWASSMPFWKNRFVRRGVLEIHLEGFSEFEAENVTFDGNFRFDVPDGIRMRVKEEKGHLVIEEEKLEERPFWTYRWNERRGILAAREQQKD